MIVSMSVRLSDLRPVDLKMDIDINWPPDYDLFWYMQQNKLPEPEIIDVMFHALRPGDVAVDGGACVGIFTVIMAHLVGDSGRVFAFEPVAQNISKTVNNMSCNNLSNITLSSRPLWSREEAVSLHDSDHPGQCSVVKNGHDVLTTTTLDISLDKVVPRFIKLDVEGAEQRVIEGASEMLKSHPPYIVVEVNESALAKFGCSQQSLRSIMASYGYEPFFLQEGMFPTHVPTATRLVTERNNLMLLFSTLDDVGALWPELCCG
jgi:FkbM family methyltransferase